MAVETRPWNGNNVLGDDGPYSDDDDALQREAYWNVTGDRGIFLGYDNELRVEANSPAAANVVVKSGAALIRGRLFLLTADETVSISANSSGNDRIDVVTAEIDWATQTGSLVVVEGNPAASPSAPTLTQSLGTKWQIPLAEVYVTNGFVTIVSDDVSDRRLFLQAAPIQYQRVQLLSSNAEDGALVKWSNSMTGTTQQVAPTTAASDVPAGVLTAKTVQNGTTYVVTSGYVARVNTTGTVSAGDLLIPSGTSGTAQAWDGGEGATHLLGTALAADGGNGYVPAIINIQRLNYPETIFEQSTGQASTTSTSFVTAKTFSQTFSFLPSKVRIVLAFTGQVDSLNAANWRATQTAGGGTFTTLADLDHTANDKWASKVILIEVDSPTAATITFDLEHKTAAGATVRTKLAQVDWYAIP